MKQTQDSLGQRHSSLSDQPFRRYSHETYLQSSHLYLYAHETGVGCCFLEQVSTGGIDCHDSLRVGLIAGWLAAARLLAYREGDPVLGCNPEIIRFGRYPRSQSLSI